MTTENIKIFSFDIFDTVITRTVAVPTDIFLLVQNQLKSPEFDLSDPFIQDFKSIRVNAESSARKKRKAEDITLDEIYNHMRETYSLSEHQIYMIKQKELEVEFRAIRPIAWTIDEIKKLRHNNKQIIFTSDMYLPKETVISFLKKVGVFSEETTLYLSNEIGLTKHSGNLFKYILEKEKCGPQQLVHFGDNIYADVFIPHSLGIGILGTSEKEIQETINCFQSTHFSLRKLNVRFGKQIKKIFKI